MKMNTSSPEAVCRKPRMQSVTSTHGTQLRPGWSWTSKGRSISGMRPRRTDIARAKLEVQGSSSRMPGTSCLSSMAMSFSNPPSHSVRLMM